MAKSQFTLDRSDDPCPLLPVEAGPHDRGVGEWVPNSKHTYLAKYIEGTHAMRARWPNRVYVDLFCATGRIRVDGEAFTRPGSAPLAWVHSNRHSAPFTKCIVGDADPSRARACGDRLRALGSPVVVLEGQASDTAGRVLAEVPRGALTTVFLDPYNLAYLSFEVIKKLSRLGRVDFAVHFSTMDLRRNVLMERNPERARFDEAAPGWRDKIDPQSFIRGDADDAFFDYWCGLIEGLGFHISDRLAPVRDRMNRPLYHLVFFSKDKRPARVWGDVAQGLNRELF